MRVTEIFLSLQGESRSSGWPTVFIRLSGCPLRCVYCDTAYAFSGGEKLSVQQILQQTERYQVRHVTVTGGEPLAQKNCHELLRRLCDAGYSVSLETSGAMDVCELDPRVERVIDIKTPGSGEQPRNRWENLQCLKDSDQIKFVITDEADYRWAIEIMQQHNLAGQCEVLFSPVAGDLSPTQLADWIVRDRLPVRFQIQLHKLLWGDKAGV
ncbi:MAG: 7-carboxy-7-deazaguanine synthase QueE [gamma proteobacterium symbiont of Bathyaustriella thionipta]|nr:7-carboxy-7-deazaguanine synthase QueE [gamma proteobacterium symbiont of Bathyaustriella thionipta]